ncbi:syntaxin, putative [Entamoeba dispar SAW760]|uniref:Syntaxin, putative n=1 Tax=Entamoeba dispar (strain ATCC PRA-260 / SAW760) TaxID=370354 RepID=B0EAG5_ENTDS|nr:syntaxin, putative [Entamoeba dispar SAW760]EDR28478.1 syntaxin, putative [Entamoeba dispar SAW760]|eukprot:EDR28478.1 syntaxin, putative [Entamoeba dispar SAW760]
MNNSTDTNDKVSQKDELTGIIVEDQTEQLPFGLMKFLSKVEEIKHQLMSIEDNNELMKIKYERIIKQMKVSDVRNDCEELKLLIQKICSDALRIEKELEEFKQENDNIKRDIESNPIHQVGESELRIRENQISFLSMKFVVTMKKSRTLQEKIKEGLIKNYQKQVKLKLQTLSVKEGKRFLHQMKLKKEPSKHINKTQSINTLAYVKSKHDEIITIIRGIDELAQTFVDAAILVEMQSEMINNICDNCEQAKEYTTEALVNIKKAQRIRKPNRFKKWSILICICLIVVIFLIVVGSILLPIIIKSAEFALV